MVINWLELLRFSSRKKRPFSAWQIELATRCSLRCRMCIRDKAKDWHGADMSIDDFKRLIPYLKDVESVILEGWGESLLHNDLIQTIRLVRGEGSQVGFVTGGFGLHEDYISELINAGVDFMGVSFAGATEWTHNSIRVNSDFNMLINSILSINEIKTGRKLETPRLHIVYLMLKENIFEIPILLGIAKAIGIEEVVLTNLIHVTNKWQEEQRVFRCDANTKSHSREGGNPDAVLAKAGNYTKELGSRFHEKPWIPASAGMTGEGLYKHYEQILKEAEIKAKEMGIKLRLPSLSPKYVPVCEENPLRNLYISVEGEVSPCVYLYPPIPSPFKRIFCGSEYHIEKVSFGNIFREQFHTIWNNKNYAQFRGCFKLRKRRFEEIYSYHWEIERLKRIKIAPLPEPPEHCRTCHKMLGV
jgi:MoaA/NifB/PqqE/SkfB family radical SAM enzyme